MANKHEITFACNGQGWATASDGGGEIARALMWGLQRSISREEFLNAYRHFRKSIGAKTDEEVLAAARAAAETTADFANRPEAWRTSVAHNDAHMRAASAETHLRYMERMVARRRAAGIF